MTATKGNTLSDEQGKKLARSVECIVEMIRDEAEDRKDVIYGASTILAMIASELMDRMGFPREKAADVKISTDLTSDASVTITWKKQEDE